MTTTIARPYAAAAFEYALAKHDLPAWETMLQAAAFITKDEALARLLSSPHVTSQQLADVYYEMLAANLDPEKTNFIRLLAENSRLTSLPAIYELFQAARAAQEKTLSVQVVSAVKLTDAYKEKLKQALTKRLQRQVQLDCEIDTSLLGGAVVRAGDTVIDGSIRGKLMRLNEFI
jgi:F-type H+-transporting ATPase subunit delta